MSKRTGKYYGRIDAPEHGKVLSFMASKSGIGFYTVPVAVFSSRDQAKLCQDACIEVWMVGKRIKARVIEKMPYE